MSEGVRVFLKASKDRNCLFFLFCFKVSALLDELLRLNSVKRCGPPKKRGCLDATFFFRSTATAKKKKIGSEKKSKPCKAEENRGRGAAAVVRDKRK